MSLYMFLVNQNNRNNWVEWFKCPFDLAMAGSGVTNKKTYYTTLLDLQNWGVLEYKKGVNNYKAPLIRLEVLYDTSIVPQSEPQLSPQVIPLPVPLCVPQLYNNIKLLTNNIEPITLDIEKIISFLDSGFKNDTIVLNTEKIEKWILELKNETQFLDGLYMTHKLRPKTIGRIALLFKEHLKMHPKNHKNFIEFRNHFGTWVGFKIKKGELGEHLKHQKGEL